MRFGTAAMAFLTLLIGSAGGVSALKVDFQASVDRVRAGQSEPIQLTLSIRSDESLSHVPAPQIDLKEFYVEGPAVSTRVEMINFETSFTRDLIYTLYARKVGKITIGAATLTLDGKTYRSKPIAIEITSRSQSRSPGQGNQQPGDEIEDNLFLRAKADRDRLYVGQQVTVDYDLYYRFRLDNVGFKELPNFSGFWAKELFVAQSLQSRREVVEGVAFNVAPLRRVALFPTRAGALQVDPLVISCDIPTRRGRRGSVFDDFVFGRPTQTVLVRSEALDFEVLPLPEQGRPKEFDGAVGQFSLQAQAQPVDLPVGDPVTLRVVIEGLGNMDAVKVPKIEAPDGIKVYEPKVEEEDLNQNGLIGGRRTYEYILIPEIEGILEVPPIRFAYFDTQREVYRLIETEALYIRTQGGEETSETETYGLSRRDIQAVGKDIRYIKPDAEELGAGVALYRRWGFWLLQGMLPVAYVGLLFYQRHRQRLEGDVAYARRRRARGEASRRLKQAGQLLEAGDSGAFHGEIQRAVLAFLADRLNVAAAGLTQESCAELLEAKGVEEEMIEEVRDLLVLCDYARFASAASGRKEMNRVRERAERIITGLEGRV